MNLESEKGGQVIQRKHKRRLCKTLTRLRKQADRAGIQQVVIHTPLDGDNPVRIEIRFESFEEV